MSEPAPAPSPAPEPAPISAVDAIYGAPKKPDPEPPKPEVSATVPVEPEPAKQPEAEGEEVEPTKLVELAEHLELDPEWIKKLKLSEKVNGSEVEFSIEEAVATHRKVQAGDTYLADAKTKSKALIDEATQQKEAWATSVATVSKLLQNIEGEINRDSKTLLTDKLKEEDPALYAVRQNELRERRERLDALKREAQQGIRDAAQKTAGEQEKLLKERLPRETEVFLERVPQLKDEAVSKAELSKLVKYLQDDGLSAQEIRALSYHGRGLAHAYKAMLHDQGKDKLETIKKKVVKIPKILKPGPKPEAAPKPNGADKTDPVSILYG